MVCAVVNALYVTRFSSMILKLLTGGIPIVLCTDYYPKAIHNLQYCDNTLAIDNIFTLNCGDCVCVCSSEVFSGYTKVEQKNAGSKVLELAGA